ncbi:MAG: hypothetical protein WCU80_02515 [Paludibacteraceae bacterium]
MNESLLNALAGTAFTFCCTAIGAAVVFLFRGEIKPKFQQIFLGFAAGVMIAAAVWSLLIPSIEMAKAQGQVGWIPAAGGFLLGGLFLLSLDMLLPHLHPGSSSPEGPHSSMNRSVMLIIAVTLHNIPEGMAVGLILRLAWRPPEMVALPLSLRLLPLLWVSGYRTYRRVLRSLFH